MRSPTFRPLVEALAIRKNRGAFLAVCTVGFEAPLFFPGELKPLQQFAVYAAEPAVAENAYHVAALHAGGDMFHNGVRVRQIRGVLPCCPSIPASAARVQPFVTRCNNSSRATCETTTASASAKALRQFRLKNIPARRVAARLEHRPDFLAFELDAQRAQRLADGRRMMAEIVHHRHAAADAAHFHAPLDALERVERRLDLLVLQAAMLRSRHHGQRVADIQFADQIEMRNLKLGISNSVAVGRQRKLNACTRLLRPGRIVSPDNA